MSIAISLTIFPLLIANNLRLIWFACVLNAIIQLSPWTKFATDLFGTIQGAFQPCLTWTWLFVIVHKNDKCLTRLNTQHRCKLCEANRSLWLQWRKNIRNWNGIRRRMQMIFLECALTNGCLRFGHHFERSHTGDDKQHFWYFYHITWLFIYFIFSLNFFSFIF